MTNTVSDQQDPAQRRGWVHALVLAFQLALAFIRDTLTLTSWVPWIRGIVTIVVVVLVLALGAAVVLVTVHVIVLIL